MQLGAGWGSDRVTHVVPVSRPGAAQTEWPGAAPAEGPPRRRRARPPWPPALVSVIDANQNSGHWQWQPGKSYGPFNFGAAVGTVPHLSRLLDRDDMGQGDVSSRWATDVAGVEVDFWNDQLVGVTSSNSFVFNGIQLIGARYQDVRGMLPTGPRMEMVSPVITVSWDDFNLMLIMDLNYLITDVAVDVDPDLLGP